MQNRKLRERKTSDRYTWRHTATIRFRSHRVVYVRCLFNRFNKSSRIITRPDKVREGNTVAVTTERDNWMSVRIIFPRAPSTYTGCTYVHTWAWCMQISVWKMIKRGQISTCVCGSVNIYMIIRLGSLTNLCWKKTVQITEK